MDRTEVIRAIVDRERRHLGIAAPRVRSDATELYESAVSQFGSWEMALKYAGVKRLKQRARTHAPTTADGICRVIRRQCSSKYSVAEPAVQRRDPALYAAAVCEFGDWKRALVAAGICPENCAAFTQAERPSKEEIIERLRARQSTGRSLQWSVMCLEERALALLAWHRFRGWQTLLRALESSGENSITDGGS